MAETPRKRGRPPTTLGKFKREIAAAQKAMAGGLVPVAEALTDAARGRWVLLVETEAGWQRVKSEAEADGVLLVGTPVRVCLVDPDVRAALEILRRVMGEVPQQINHEVRGLIEATVEDQATLVRILEEHVPAEYLAPVLAELRRVREHHRAATSFFTS